MIIDIENVIAVSDHDERAIANLLFPEHGDRMGALRRLYKEPHKLTAEQAFLVAKLLGVRVDDLFSIEKWMPRPNPHKDLLAFTRGDYFMLIDTSTSLCDVYTINGHTVLTELTVPKFVELRELMVELDKKIKKYESNNRNKFDGRGGIEQEPNSGARRATRIDRRNPLGLFYHSFISWDSRKELRRQELEAEKLRGQSHRVRVSDEEKERIKALEAERRALREGVEKTVKRRARRREG